MVKQCLKNYSERETGEFFFIENESNIYSHVPAPRGLNPALIVYTYVNSFEILRTFYLNVKVFV